MKSEKLHKLFPQFNRSHFRAAHCTCSRRDQSINESIRSTFVLLRVPSTRSPAAVFAVRFGLVLHSAQFRRNAKGLESHFGQTSCTLGANQCHFTRRQTCRLQSQSWRAVWTVAIALAHAQKVQIGLPLCGLRDHLPR
uniref:(northern house mosquito) hypothetical protein n=1 Tax=Culex pipiens TaxID=7175 RepID=A0A8D8AHZ4_CULPI